MEPEEFDALVADAVRLVRKLRSASRAADARGFDGGLYAAAADHIEDVNELLVGFIGLESQFHRAMAVEHAP